MALGRRNGPGEKHCPRVSQPPRPPLSQLSPAPLPTSEQPLPAPASSTARLILDATTEPLPSLWPSTAPTALRMHSKPLRLAPRPCVTRPYSCGSVLEALVRLPSLPHPAWYLVLSPLCASHGAGHPDLGTKLPEACLHDVSVQGRGEQGNTWIPLVP